VFAFKATESRTNVKGAVGADSPWTPDTERSLVPLKAPYGSPGEQVARGLSLVAGTEHLPSRYYSATNEYQTLPVLAYDQLNTYYRPETALMGLSADPLTTNNPLFPVTPIALTGLTISGPTYDAGAYLTELSPDTIIVWTDNATSSLTEEDIRETESDEFLETIYVQVSSRRVSGAIYAVIDHLDRLMNDGLFGVCNRLLAKVELERLPSNVRRAFLMVTKPAKEKLSMRPVFYNEALRLLSAERGEETARKMLKTLA
jgi:hypothetical protein